jgi:ABC-type polysaccharide/polyol phosphate export permease
LSANTYTAAWQDIITAFERRNVWLTLGSRDVSVMYRKSVLGPLWVILSTAVLVFAVNLFYAKLFELQKSEFLPHVAGGFVVWMFFINLFITSTSVFANDGQIMRQVNISPLIVHLRLLWRQIVMLAYQFLILLVVLALDVSLIRWELLYVVPGLILLILNAFWMSVVIAIMSARFRDMPPIVGAAMQFIFFLTPVLWFRTSLGPEFWYVDYNPFLHLIDIVREPIAGKAVPAHSYLITAIMAAIGLVIAFITYAKNRTKIVFWI